ncbi:hypothetical protein ColLi_01131 [Colletotrichum liriopes]|uniref:Uncharacterized protein n=1 Tax=Colletotrichum liriopes TaxID=708192 RepID=A0AA37GD99_9PEZI|nr:hypothetical protein ColLi_01131 [Colletotrichum liriopes]
MATIPAEPLNRTETKTSQVEDHRPGPKRLYNYGPHLGGNEEYDEDEGDEHQEQEEEEQGEEEEEGEREVEEEREEEEEEEEEEGGEQGEEEEEEKGEEEEEEEREEEEEEKEEEREEEEEEENEEENEEPESPSHQLGGRSPSSSPGPSAPQQHGSRTDPRAGNGSIPGGRGIGQLGTASGQSNGPGPGRGRAGGGVAFKKISAIGKALIAVGWAPRPPKRGREEEENVPRPTRKRKMDSAESERNESVVRQSVAPASTRSRGTGTPGKRLSSSFDLHETPVKRPRLK